MRFPFLKSFLLIGLFLTLISCSKDEDCFDPALMAGHSGICTTDCPGVCGCDGETYCNECVANSMGIRIVGNSPCP